MLSIFLAFFAGFIGILSPCVLPILPIILGSSLNESKYGPVCLAAGLISSFTFFGLVVARVGFSIGLTTDVLQTIASVLMMAFGVVLLIPFLYNKFTELVSKITSSLNSRASMYDAQGLIGQFILGLILGAVWTPCVGPTLGAAISLAAQGKQLFYATLVMFAFALGTSLPIVILAYGSRGLLSKRKEMFRTLSQRFKPIMGAIFLLIGILIFTGGLSVIESFFYKLVPTKVIDFIYSF